MAFDGANINDSVANYFLWYRKVYNTFLTTENRSLELSLKAIFLRCKNIGIPDTIIFQIIWRNDICASEYIEEKIKMMIVKDFKYILPIPNPAFIKKMLFTFCIDRIYAKIYRDLSDERFIKYVKEPLDKLVRCRAKIIIISFDNDERFEDYNEKLSEYCLLNNIDYYHIEDILEKKYLECRLPDGRHPSAELNKELAYRIRALLETN